MKTSLVLQLSAECAVRATPDSFRGDQQIVVEYFPRGEGYTTLTFLAPSIKTRNQLVAALIACGCWEGK